MANKLTIRINGDVKGYSEALKTAEAGTKDLSGALASIAKKSAATFAVLSAAIYGNVAAYRVQEQAEAKTRAIIKATGSAAGVTAEQVFKMAGALQELTTFGDEAIINGQNLLLTFKNIGGDIFPRVTEAMLDMSAVMGTDLKATAIQMGKALNDPIKGVASLSRVGVAFTKQQLKQIRVMQESGDVAGAQNVILKELEGQFGGTAKAIAGGTGQFIQLKNVAGDFAEDIGKNLTPILGKLATAAKEGLLWVRDHPEISKWTARILLAGVAVTGLITVVATAGAGLLAFKAAMFAANIATAGMLTTTRLLVGATGIGLLLILISDLALNWDKRLIQMQSAWSAFADNIGSIGGSLAGVIAGVFTFDVEKVQENLAALKETSLKAIDEYQEEVKARTDEAPNPFVPTVEATIIKKEELDAELETQRAADLEKETAHQEALKDIQKGTLKDLKDARRSNAIDDAKAAQAEKNQQLKDEARHGKALAKAKAFFRSKEVEGTGKTLDMLATLGRSGNKQLGQIAKVSAISRAIMNTASGVTAALGAYPPPINFALAAATAAAGAVQIGVIRQTGFAKGGAVTGGIPGVDSVPIIAQQREIISPAQNYDELIGSVRAKREADKLGKRETSMPSAFKIGVELFFPDGADEFIEGRVIENRALGIGAI